MNAHKQTRPHPPPHSRAEEVAKAVAPVDTSPSCLDQCSEKNTPEFSLKGLYYDAKCLRVIDGDTVVMAIEVNNPIIDLELGAPKPPQRQLFPQFVRVHCRLLGVDCPEIRRCSPEEKVLGLKAKEFVEGLLYDEHGNGRSDLTVCFDDFGNFGRPLADILIDGKKLTTLLLENGHAALRK